MRKKILCKMGIASARNGVISGGRLHCIKSFKLASDQSMFSQI